MAAPCTMSCTMSLCSASTLNARVSVNTAWPCACRLHQSSAVYSATSPVATALPFSPARPEASQAETPRFATMGGSSQYASMLHEPSPSANVRLSRFQRDSNASTAHARDYFNSSLLPRSPQPHTPNSMGSLLQSPAANRQASHAASDLQGSLHRLSRLQESAYDQDKLFRSPSGRASSSSPYRGALAGSSPHRPAAPSSSPHRSPAHAAAVSAVEQQLHASLHGESGPLTSSRIRAVPDSPAPLTRSHQSQEGSQSRLDSTGAYQRWKGHATAAVPQQDSHHRPYTMPDSLSHQTLLGQLPGHSEPLLQPLHHQHGHASPELDSLSQRLRDQKLVTYRQSHIGTSPMQGRAASSSPSRAYASYSSGMQSRMGHRTGLDPVPPR